MNFEKKNNIYKIIMMILITILITFLITSIGMYNYFTKGSISKITNQEQSYDAITKKISLIRSIINKYYLGDVESEDQLIEYAVKGYVAGIGENYTNYLTKDEYDELMLDINGNFVGIGVYITQDKYENILVLAPIEGSPAEEADLKPGDIIQKIDGKECVGVETEEVSNRIKGEQGTEVELEILRNGEIITKKIQRRKVEIYKVKSEILDNNIGYIKLPSFDEDSSKKFKEHLDNLIEKGAKSLILDLRSNGGGVVDEAKKVADLFLDKDKVIVIEKTKNDGTIEMKAEKEASFKGNIVILCDEYSASASEILIAALKENEIAKVVGTLTYGKGVMQELIPLEGGGALKVTIEEFLTPNGNKINKVGIKPNVEIEDNEETEEDEQLQKAIEILK